MTTFAGLARPRVPLKAHVPRLARATTMLGMGYVACGEYKARDR